ncbi:MAG: LAGLIDADG family homing endonuclease [Acidobacteria bacterium]|nr:LAGLIDADG family homing endonuclease [Acidobacteriota bacterium]
MKADGRRNITTKLAYLAGFFDGEGCIRIKRSYRLNGNSYYLTVTVANSDRTVLENYVELFGGKVYTKGRSANFQQYHWEASSGEAADFLRTMIGYLRGKKPQAVAALEFHDNLPLLTPEQRREAHDRLRAMKLVVIGNIYSNPELVKEAA